MENKFVIHNSIGGEVLGWMTEDHHFEEIVQLEKRTGVSDDTCYPVEFPAGTVRHLPVMGVMLMDKRTVGGNDIVGEVHLQYATLH